MTDAVYHALAYNAPKGQNGLYDPEFEQSNCGTGYITRKDGKQTHEVLELVHQALCVVPHRGGMSSEGIGDGAGVNLDLSENFFQKVTNDPSLKLGDFGVGNFFMPNLESSMPEAEALIERSLEDQGFEVLVKREVETDPRAIREAAVPAQLPIRQWVFRCAKGDVAHEEFDTRIHEALLAIEAEAFTKDHLDGLFPLSMSARTQVLKGRLNSNEVVPYFLDLADPDMQIHTIFFHTRFSTNTAPHPRMAQPFRLMSHNGELNTDKKNRLSENTIARMKNRQVIAPKGQSDSARLDQTLERRLIEDKLDIVTAIVAMMPPAWENDPRVSPPVRAMLEYFSLYEEKNDGPAAIMFGNGDVVGARLDRLGLRPLRSVETNDYLAVMSEAGQIDFPAEDVIARGRIESGGMLWYDHKTKRSYGSEETLELLAAKRDYASLLEAARLTLDDIEEVEVTPRAANDDGAGLTQSGRYVAFNHNQESFKFLMDPMLQNGAEKVSAMGYGVAINSLTDQEGGMAKYFSQRFAQVTNPPLDSLKESDGMTLRVALGAKPFFNRDETTQLVIENPILAEADLARIKSQTRVPVHFVDMTYTPDSGATDAGAAKDLTTAVDAMCDAVQAAAEGTGGIVILSDDGVSSDHAALPLILAVSAANQRLISCGLRFRVSLVAESGQIASSHHIATALGFGAAAVAPIAAYERAAELFGSHGPEAVGRFIKAGSKALMKTMGKVGLCTVESYSGGEFFEPNYLNTNEKTLGRYFPNVRTPVGGVGLETIAGSVRDWHKRATEVKDEAGIPLLGLFKERADGAGHSYGVQAVRSFEDMTAEPIGYQAEAMSQDESSDLRLMTLDKLKDSVGLDEAAYKSTGFDKRDASEIDGFCQTEAYKNFARDMAKEREERPAALRDVLDFPTDFTEATTQADFLFQLNRHDLRGNASFAARGVTVSALGGNRFAITLDDGSARLAALSAALKVRFNNDISFGSQTEVLEVTAKGDALSYLSRIVRAPDSLPLNEVEAPSSITTAFASGAMSHGALVAPAHEAVAHGTNIVGAMSNSGEGGEHFSRYGTIRSSKIKQIASGRFGVWAGYLADPAVEELEIKIAQGAKPGEGGQLPAQKVTVEIAAARGGTPGVELVSPPPHHDTYSIEDLAQLIHDCKAARVRVIVKLVSSEGIGTIAVGVAKAGADVINIAGNTGGTGAAQVTSLKYTGRSAEIGLAEVHQALCANGIRKKVILRCSGAHQTATDVVKSCLLGGDSFEFGTTALMMLKCVMAKNCNVKCPAGLTTNPEVFEGDPRALAQYFMNVAHDVQAILAKLGMPTLRAARGRSDLLHLLNHPSMIGQMDVSAMLWHEPEVVIENPVYVPRDFAVDDYLLPRVKEALIDRGRESVELGDNYELNNCNKTVFGQLAIDLERMLQYDITEEQAGSLPSIRTDKRGRRFFDEASVRITTCKSAGQSYGAFLNDGMHITHSGTANDGVGKSMSGGTIVVKSPGGGSPEAGGNVLIGNFGLFGATGGRLFVEGEAGDRFAVRNSGTVAVVEGLGDFGCEYMTNGAVLNLGAFGKGFGNGMSGGYAYQYDPEEKLEASYSADSVFFCNLADDTEEAAIHRDAVRQMLTEHVAETGSERGKAILENFDAEVANFRYLKPQSFAVYQDADAILAKASRKALVEELAKALASHQVRKFKVAYRDGLTVLDGAVPTPADTDSDKMFALLNSYTVLAMAQRIAADRLKTDSRTREAQAAARKLLLTEDFALMMALTKYAREALATYSDAELATLIANKRLDDYKQALSLRNVLSVQAGGTYGWIILQDRLNRERMGTVPSFEELFAAKSTPDLVQKAS